MAGLGDKNVDRLDEFARADSHFKLRFVHVR